MKRVARNKASTGRASIALAVLGAALALLGGLFLYARENVFDADTLADRAEDALSDQRLRLAVAQPITDAIVDSGPPQLVNARPLIESVVTGALGTAPVRAAFGEAVRAAAATLFERDPDALLLNLADAATLAAGTIEAVSPKLAAQIPDRVSGAEIELTGRDESIEMLALAEDVRIAGLLLPVLAVLLLIGSVALAPSRRAGLVRAGLALSGAAVAGLILLLVARGLLTAQFDDPLVRDAVSGAWEAMLGDLRGALLYAGIAAIVLTAAARFTTEGEFDPLAPFMRAGELLRRRPESASLAVLRAVGLALIGFALVLSPELSLEAVAVVAGAWVLYVAVGELLTIVAPQLPAPSVGQGRPKRRVRPKRLAALGAATALAVVLVLVSTGGGEVRIRPPGAPAACNGYVQICEKRIDEVTFPATHNSMSAASEPGWFLPNQRYGIIRQLDDGIRGLLVDTHYGIQRGNGRGFAEVITDLQKEGKTRREVVDELGEEAVQKAESLVDTLAFEGAPGEPRPYLCHVLCELGATDLDVALAAIEDWVSSHPDEFLVLFVEDVISPEETAEAFEASGLLRYAYVPDRSAPSPPLGELIESDRRVLIMAENDAGGGRYPWYQQGFDLVQETPFTFRSVAEIESRQSCRPNRGSPSNPLFLINSWIEKIPRDPALAAEIDSEEALLARVRRCERIRGLQPNLIAVDYYEQGDVFAVANRLNGIPAGEPPQVRTLP